jgi:phosphohistidine phosphatase
MKYLAVMRHAEAINASSDLQRPLSPSGVLQALEVGKVLSQSFTPSSVIVSTSVRTRMTSDKVGESYVDWEDHCVYDASLRSLVTVLAEQDDTVERSMLIGHNPGVSYLVSSLTGIDCSFPTGTVILISFDVASWSELTNVSGKVIFSYSPKV